jgi:hypothetical protein
MVLPPQLYQQRCVQGKPKTLEQNLRLDPIELQLYRRARAKHAGAPRIFQHLGAAKNLRRHWHMGTRHAGAAVLGICYSFCHREVVAATCSRLGLPVVTCCYFWEEVVVATCSCLGLPVVTCCYFWEEEAAAVTC